MMTENLISFDGFVEGAAGYSPYDYQRRIALDGLPELLDVPTGAGKTLAAVLPWLWRRRHHPEVDVRRATPHWLVVALPMRVLVDQTHDVVSGWLAALDLSESVGLYRVMGGEGRVESQWRLEPEQDAIFVGTIDMLLSRALNRGYGESRWAWPIDFGLLNSGTQWVFDEVQLMGAALPSTRQLAAFRSLLGNALPSASMWMSATPRKELLSTVDNPDLDSIVEVSQTDIEGSLATRLAATRTVRQLSVDEGSYDKSLAVEVAEAHKVGTRTLVMLNSVERAQNLFKLLTKAKPEAEVVLVHSRFRPGDRKVVVDRAIADPDPSGPGLIVVSTQVLEAGVDITSETLITEVAPWPSVVQRAGRCNREGEAHDAHLRWVRAPKAAPYEDDDLQRSAAALTELEGERVTAVRLAEIEVEVTDPVHAVLRRRDLIDLFDTLPDLSGNDVDVSRFIRDIDDLDVQVVWRDLGGEPPDPSTPPPGSDERCSVPVGSLRKELKKPFEKRRKAWRYDHLRGAWVILDVGDLRPGIVVILEASEGGYLPERGWDTSSKKAVEPVEDPEDEADVFGWLDDATDADPATYTGRWMTLRDHLGDVENEVRVLADALSPALPTNMVEAAAVAGRLHDVGKAHSVFQTTLQKCADGSADQMAAAQAAGEPWAKSGCVGRGPRHERRYFRHELASALALLGAGGVVLDGVDERDLVVYLVAAHHGRVRLGFRSLPDETRPPDGDRLVALGVWDGDELPPVEIPGGTLPAAALDLSVMELGSRDGRPSWSGRMLGLRDRPDLGPFRLAFLEALVRLADWRASAAGYQGTQARRGEADG